MLSCGIRVSARFNAPQGREACWGPRVAHPSRGFPLGHPKLPSVDFLNQIGAT